MFRTIWLKTLRDYRIPILGWGIGLGLYLFALLASVNSAALAAYAPLAEQFRFFGDPVAMTTNYGYATYRGTNFAQPIFLSIWTILAGAYLVRGEEERGSLDVLLSTPQSRVRLFLEKLLAFIIALLLIAILLGTGAIAGEASAKIAVDGLRAMLAALNISLMAFFFGSFALLLSQLLQNRRTAAGWIAGLMVFLWLLDNTGRVVNNGAWLQYLSPFYYLQLNKPLIVTYPANLGAAALLLLISIVCVAISLYLFVRRDVGGVALPSWDRIGKAAHARTSAQILERASRSIFERSVILRALRAQATSVCWWLLVIAACSVFLTLLIPTLEAPLQKFFASNPVISKLFGGHNVNANEGFLGSLLFAFMPVAVVIFAFVQSLPWVSDLENGRLELILSTPKPRSHVILERFGAVLVFSIIAPLLIWLGVLVGAFISNLSIDGGHVAAASLSLLPLELIAVVLVYLLAGRLRYGVVLGSVCTYITLAFIAEFLQSLLNLPDWVLSFSIFHQYGSPITDGLQWGPFLTMLGIAIVLLILGVVQFTRADVERGA